MRVWSGSVGVDGHTRPQTHSKPSRTVQRRGVRKSCLSRYSDFKMLVFLQLLATCNGGHSQSALPGYERSHSQSASAGILSDQRRHTICSRRFLLNYSNTTPSPSRIEPIVSNSGNTQRASNALLEERMITIPMPIFKARYCSSRGTLPRRASS
jgi:hypothetical protein